MRNPNQFQSNELGVVMVTVCFQQSSLFLFSVVFNSVQEVCSALLETDEENEKD